MRASELIRYIQKQIELHGDLHVTAFGCNDQYSRDNPEFILSTDYFRGAKNVVPFFIIEPKDKL